MLQKDGCFTSLRFCLNFYISAKNIIWGTLNSILCVQIISSPTSKWSRGSRLSFSIEQTSISGWPHWEITATTSARSGWARWLSKTPELGRATWTSTSPGLLKFKLRCTYLTIESPKIFFGKITEPLTIDSSFRKATFNIRFKVINDSNLANVNFIYTDSP